MTQCALWERSITEFPSPMDFSLIPKNENIQATVMKMRDEVQFHEKIMCSISGGWDSDIMLDLIIRCGGKKKTAFCFFDTGLEYDATKEHIKYLEQVYGVSIKVLKPKKAIPTCCKEYGVPFWSKFVSDMIHRLQKNGFEWKDKPFDVLYAEYPGCKAALRWWCNEWGEGSKFNISRVRGMKEFILENHPPVLISTMCCQKAKKDPAGEEELSGYDMICTGVRKAEGGTRSTGFSSCFDQKLSGPDYYRPLFWWSSRDKEVYTKWFGLQRSDCYGVWGMNRTGCAGCPFGKQFEEELDLVRQYEPKRYKAMLSVFGESYDYTRKFLKFREQMDIERAKETDERQIKMEGF